MTDDNDISKTTNQVLAIGAVVCALMMAVVMVFCVYNVLDSLTQPTPIATSLLDRFVLESKANKTSEQQAVNESDNSAMTVQLAVILEYANADIRASGIQVAFSLVAGLFFATTGVLLFAAGMTGAINLSTDTPAFGKLSMSSSAPGLVSMVLGAVIIGYGVTKDMSRPMEAEVMKALRLQVSSGTKGPPGPGEVEGSVDSKDSH